MTPRAWRRPARPQHQRNGLILLAFQLAILTLINVSPSHQLQATSAAAASESSSSSENHGAGSGGPVGPMLSMGSETSSALESSAAVGQDDLMAAESSPSAASSSSSNQPVEAPAVAIEHSKPFSRSQEPQQQQQQQPQFVAQSNPQQIAQQPPFHGQPQQMQQAPMQRLPPHLQLQPKAYNPYMAAALAAINQGQFGAHMGHGFNRQQQPQMHLQQQHHHAHHPHHHQIMQQQQHQQMQQPQVLPAQVQVQQQAQLQSQSQPQPQPQTQQAQQQPQPQAQVQPMAVQESTLRQNVVPAPSSFQQPQQPAAMVDSNSIDEQTSPSGQHSIITSSSASSTALQPSQQQQQEPSAWPLQAPDIPKIVNLEVKCEKNLMKVSIEFDKVFNGVIFSKGHYNQGQCVHVGQNSGKQQAYFDIAINTCGTQGNGPNGIYGMGANTGSGTFFENTIVVQYDPNVQEVYDHARKLRCTWHDQYEKAVTFRPFPVDMLDIVRADFAGDNVGCWMQIQVGKGPWASEVAGIVKIGQTMTMVLAIKDEENKFDMLVRNCFAHDGKRGPIELVDKNGCITRPKLMSRFAKVKNFGSSATVLSYAHFQAFKFPDSMEVHFQCTIQICRHTCPSQCSSGPDGSLGLGGPNGPEAYSESTISGTFNIGSQGQGAAAAAVASTPGESLHLRKYGSSLSRERRDLSAQTNSSRPHLLGSHLRRPSQAELMKTVGVNRVIQVVSTGDLAFTVSQQQQQAGDLPSSGGSAEQLTRVVELQGQICMSSYSFVLSLVLLGLVLLCSSLAAISLCLRQRSLSGRSCSSSKLDAKLLAACSSPTATLTSSTLSSSASSSSLRSSQVPSQQQQAAYYQQQHQPTNHRHHHHLLVGHHQQ